MAVRMKMKPNTLAEILFMKQSKTPIIRINLINWGQIRDVTLILCSTDPLRKGKKTVT